jgi:hypothetical protein
MSAPPNLSRALHPTKAPELPGVELCHHVAVTTGVTPAVQPLLLPEVFVLPCVPQLVYDVAVARLLDQNRFYNMCREACFNLAAKTGSGGVNTFDVSRVCVVCKI